MKQPLHAVLFFLALSMIVFSCGQQKGKNNNVTKPQNSANDDAWLQGEWKNAVYGDIADIYPDNTIRFLKNGLVFSKEEAEDWMRDYPKPETIDDLDGNILLHEKFPYKEGRWYELKIGDSIEALLFDYLTGEYPFEPIPTYLGIDNEIKQLYYYSDRGEKVFLTKTSDVVYDAQLQKVVADENENLSKEIAAHEFDWLRGYWNLNFMTHCVVNIDDDSVKVEFGETDETTGRFVANPSQTQKDPIKLQYENNDFTNEANLVLVPSGICVDKESQSLYTYYDFDQRVDFEHVSAQTQEEEPSITKVKKVARGIHGLKDQASYTWVDENLKGRVKSYVEKVEYYHYGGPGYCVTKKFDEKGNIVYYYSDANWILGCGIYPKGEDLPTEDKTPNDFILDHNLLNPVHIKFKGGTGNTTGNLDNIERTYKYDILGNLTALYENNRLLYEFEYDTYGRVTKLLENGKPNMKITWGYNWDPSHVAYTIKFYSPEGYDAGEYKYAWKSEDVLATIKNNGKEDYYSYPEFTFYSFPQVKTVTYGRTKGSSTSCYFYDEEGHMTRVVKSNNKIELYNFNNNPRGAVEEYFVGYCRSYKYNDNGDVCSASSSVIYWPWEQRAYNEFIDYIFRYNFNKLPAPDKETRWRYVYDDHGNWTKRERFEVIHGDIDIENLQDITIREYVYYE